MLARRDLGIAIGMQFRLSPEAHAGVCLWAHDQEARDAWGYAIFHRDLPLSDLLKADLDALVVLSDHLVPLESSSASVSSPTLSELEARCRALLPRLQAELGPAILVSRPAATEANAPAADACGTVLALFHEPHHALRAAEMLHGHVLIDGLVELPLWIEVHGPSASESPRAVEPLLHAASLLSGVLATWWQEKESGHDAMVEGDLIEEAAIALRTRNYPGFANLLVNLRCRQLRLSPSVVADNWTPTRDHRQRSRQGSWWDWWTFLRAAHAALQGRPISPRYLKKERHRLLFHWTEGGTQQGWPRDLPECLQRRGFKRDGFSRWSLASSSDV